MCRTFINYLINSLQFKQWISFNDISNKLVTNWPKTGPKCIVLWEEWPKRRVIGVKSLKSCQSCHSERERSTQPNLCLYSALKRCPICPTLRPSIGRCLWCPPEWNALVSDKGSNCEEWLAQPLQWRHYLIQLLFRFTKQLISNHFFIHLFLSFN